MIKYHAPLLEKYADNPYNNHLSSDINIKINLLNTVSFY